MSDSNEKNNKYLIVVKGQRSMSVPSPLDTCEYYIRAANEEKAQERAASLYRDKNPYAEITSVTKKRQLDALTIVLMFIPCLLSFIPWYGSGTSIFSIQPTMFSLLIAIGLYSAVIIRVKGLHNSFNNASQTVLSLLTILFCASFLNMFIGEAQFKFLWFDITISGNVILAIAFLFSWLGISSVAGFVWIVLFIWAVTRIIKIDNAMGIWGLMYILSAFLGIVFQLKQQSEDFLRSIGREIKGIGAQSHRKVFKDIGKSSDFVKDKIH